MRARPAIRAVRVQLLSLDRQPLAIVHVVADGRMPPVVMFRGEPFLPRGMNGELWLYEQTRPFRVDDGMVLEGEGA